MVYIALRVQREPLDQTNLSNGLDAILKVVGNRHSKEADRWGPPGPGGPTYRSAGPHGSGSSPASVIRLLDPSRVFPRWYHGRIP